MTCTGKCAQPDAFKLRLRHLLRKSAGRLWWGPWATEPVERWHPSSYCNGGMELKSDGVWTQVFVSGVLVRMREPRNLIGFIERLTVSATSGHATHSENLYSHRQTLDSIKTPKVKAPLEWVQLKDCLLLTQHKSWSDYPWEVSPPLRTVSQNIRLHVGLGPHLRSHQVLAMEFTPGRLVLHSPCCQRGAVWKCIVNEPLVLKDKVSCLMWNKSVVS